MIKKINLSKKIEEKKDINMIESDILDSSKHISMINMILLDAKFDGKSTIIKNLKQKLNSYKSQDKKKNRFNEKTFISYDQLLEKLVISKLNCEYFSILVDPLQAQVILWEAQNQVIWYLILLFLTEL